MKMKHYFIVFLAQNLKTLDSKANTIWFFNQKNWA